MKLFHYWKPILKQYKKIEIYPKCYTYRWECEDADTHHARKNNYISFSLFGKCITIQYRKFPKGFKDDIPAMGVKIKF